MSSRDRNRQGTTTSGLSRRQQHNADAKRSANAVGLTDFSQKKGQVRALEEFKKRKNKKHLETSMALRKYRKIMKKEGMDAGTGASRKRRANINGDKEEDEEGWNDEENDLGGSDDDEALDDSKANRKRQSADQSDSDGSDNDKNSDDNQEEEKIIEDSREKKEQKKKQTKPKKMDPFQKSREKAKLAKQRTEEAALMRVSGEKERQQKLKRRKQQTKLLQQRTKRGQPIMKHAINNLLYKLEKQKNETSEASATRPNADHRRHKKQNQDLPKPKQARDDAQENPSQKNKKKARKFY